MTLPYLYTGLACLVYVITLILMAFSGHSFKPREWILLPLCMTLWGWWALLGRAAYDAMKGLTR